jgi:hypothetical protein
MGCVEEEISLKFWVVWVIDALLSAIAIFYFFLGLVDGSVSSFNIGIWIVVLAALTVVVSGSLWLKSIGRQGLGVMLLLVLAVPAVLYALFLLIVITSGSKWN